MRKTIIMDYEEVLVEVTKHLVSIECVIELENGTDDVSTDSWRELEKSIFSSDQVFLKHYRRLDKEVLEEHKSIPNLFRNLPWVPGLRYWLHKLREDVDVMVCINDKNNLNDKIHYLKMTLDFKASEIFTNDSKDSMRLGNCYISSDQNKLDEFPGEKVFFNFLYKPVEIEGTKVVHNWTELKEIKEDIVAITKQSNRSESQESGKIAKKSLPQEKVCLKTDFFEKTLADLKQYQTLKILYYNQEEDEVCIANQFSKAQKQVHIINVSGGFHSYYDIRNSTFKDGEQVLLMNSNNGYVGILGVCTIIGEPFIDIKCQYAPDRINTDDIFKVLIRMDALRSIHDEGFKMIKTQSIKEMDLGLKSGEIILSKEYIKLLDLSDLFI